MCSCGLQKNVSTNSCNKKQKCNCYTNEQSVCLIYGVDNEIKFYVDKEFYGINSIIEVQFLSSDGGVLYNLVNKSPRYENGLMVLNFSSDDIENISDGSYAICYFIISNGNNSRYKHVAKLKICIENNMKYIYSLNENVEKIITKGSLCDEILNCRKAGVLAVVNLQSMNYLGTFSTNDFEFIVNNINLDDDYYRVSVEANNNEFELKIGNKTIKKNTITKLSGSILYIKFIGNGFFVEKPIIYIEKL